MKSAHCHSLAFFLFCCLLLGSECAEAKGRGIPIPIFFGNGERVSHLAELPAEVKEEIKRETDMDAAVGFLYERFHIFFLDIWTWNGRYVLYEDDGYFEIPSEMREALIVNGVEGFRRPIFYTFPLGGIILALILTAVFVIPILFPSPERQVRKLFGDERYQEALRLYSDKVSPPDDSVGGSNEGPINPERAFRSAVEHLQGKGITREEAERNLQIMFHVLAANQQATRGV